MPRFALPYIKMSCIALVIEPKNYFEYTPGVLHLLTGSNAVNALMSKFAEVSRGSSHCRGYFDGVKPSSKVAVVKSLGTR